MLFKQSNHFQRRFDVLQPSNSTGHDQTPLDSTSFFTTHVDVSVENKRKRIRETLITLGMRLSINEVSLLSRLTMMFWRDPGRTQNVLLVESNFIL